MDGTMTRKRKAVLLTLLAALLCALAVVAIAHGTVFAEGDASGATEEATEAEDSVDGTDADETDGSEDDNVSDLALAEAATADADETTVCTVDGTGYSDLSSAVSAIADSDSKTGTIVITADITLPYTESDQAIISIPDGVNITIEDDGSAHTITSTDGSELSRETVLFYVNEGGSLTINASNLTITRPNDGELVASIIYCEGTLELKAGTLDLNGNYITPYESATRSSKSGGIVVVSGSNAVFNMSGGTVTNAKGKDDLADTGRVSCVRVCSNGTFNMSGGTISKFDGGKNYYAGAVLLYATSSNSLYGSGNATFNMTGGTIESNSGFRGAAVYLYGDNLSYRATFNMSDGTIQKNTSYGISSDDDYLGAGAVMIYGNSAMTMSGGTITNNTVYGGVGGGVATGDAWVDQASVWVNAFGVSNAYNYFKYYYPASFTMTGGSITNNKSFCQTGSDGSSYGGHGGGLYVSSGNVTLSGGSITYNWAEKYGGGVYTAGGSSGITVSGCTITGNIADVGGGLYLAAAPTTTSDGTESSTTTFTATAGTIANNLATTSADDIYAASTETLSISGLNSDVKYLADDKGASIDGWYEDTSTARYYKEGTYNITEVESISSGTEYYLVAAHDLYTVTYYDGYSTGDDGEVLNDGLGAVISQTDDNIYGAAVPTTDDPTRTGYRFLGWELVDLTEDSTEEGASTEESSSTSATDDTEGATLYSSGDIASMTVTGDMAFVAQWELASEKEESADDTGTSEEESTDDSGSPEEETAEEATEAEEELAATGDNTAFAIACIAVMGAIALVAGITVGRRRRS